MNKFAKISDICNRILIFEGNCTATTVATSDSKAPSSARHEVKVGAHTLYIVSDEDEAKDIVDGYNKTMAVIYQVVEERAVNNIEKLL